MPTYTVEFTYGGTEYTVTAAGGSPIEVAAEWLAEEGIFVPGSSEAVTVTAVAEAPASVVIAATSYSTSFSATGWSD